MCLTLKEAKADLKKALDEQGHSGSTARRHMISCVRRMAVSRHVGLKWPCFAPQAVGQQVNSERKPSSAPRTHACI